AEWAIETGADCDAIIARETGLAVAGAIMDDPIRRNFPDFLIVGVGNKDVSGGIHRYTARIAERRFGGYGTVDGLAACTGAGDDGHQQSLPIHLINEIGDEIGDIEISAGIERNSRRVLQCERGSWDIVLE